MIKKFLVHALILLVVVWNGRSVASVSESKPGNCTAPTGTFEKMIVTQGTVTFKLDRGLLNRIRPQRPQSDQDAVRFEVGADSFFTIHLFNGVLRGPDPGSLVLISPGETRAASGVFVDQLVLEKRRSGTQFDLVVRDGKTGPILFNIERDLFEYDAATHSLSVSGARLLVSDTLGQRLGRPGQCGTVVGTISLTATVVPIEIRTIVKGKTESSVLPVRADQAPSGPNGFALGPDIIVGELPDMVEAGNNGSQVGLGIATTSCNNGNREVHFLALPDTDHSVVAQNLYRMSDGASNDDRFEQIGQGWVKHTFGADQGNDCGFGCTPSDFTALGVGCSDPYLAMQNAGYSLLGSRAWINPFTGAFPSTAANHSGHIHNATSHRLLVNVSDLDTTQNAGASYFAEASYDIRQEYEWCQTHPGECNMYNNASYRRFNVSGTTTFTFSPAESTVRMTPAIYAWTGATIHMIEPEPGVDGRAFIACKVTNPSAGLWHYEYALYNRNLDRAIQSFRVPLGPGVTISDTGFHAPENPAGFPNDGTMNNAGFSNAAWTTDQTTDSVTWNSETFTQNQNANAIRWGTMYNFRFDSNRSPYFTNVTIGFFKTGEPVTVEIQVPIPDGVTPTPTPQPTPTPTSTPSATPVVTPSPTPGPIAQPLNLSTRLDVGTDSNVAIGGFIITGTEPKQILLRGIGPSLAGAGILDALPDPVLELHGPDGFSTIINNNWRDVQASEINATGLAPADDLESAILVTLNPGLYTAILRDLQDLTGLGLVELYDLAPDAASNLANLSTRGFVGTGSNILIAGFILGDGSDDPIVLRGVNPLGSELDPRLELRDSDGNLIAFDEDWQDDPAQAALIMAAGLAPNDPHDAAIASWLSPGAYTALLMGSNNTTGVGLVEVYDNPASEPRSTPSPGGSVLPVVKR